MFGSVLDHCAELLELLRTTPVGAGDQAGDASGDGVGVVQRRRLPVGVWVGFADLGSNRGKEVLELLRLAGVTRVVFTPTNDASRSSWSWQPSRRQLVRGLVAAKAAGLEVWLGPWVRCSGAFMDRCGLELARLGADVGGVDGWELDAEGSFEVTARRAGRLHPRGVAGAVGECMDRMLVHRKTESIGATVLYFNRPAGDALIRHSAVTEATIQAYSVWFSRGSKAAATQTKAFSPGILQETAIDNYDDFKADHSIDRLLVGLGWWSQDRSKAPADRRMSKADAFRLASDAVLASNAVDGVCGWAVHLWDSPVKRTEKVYLDLVLDEVRYLTGGVGVGDAVGAGVVQDKTAANGSVDGVGAGVGDGVAVWPPDPAGVVIHWERRWTDPSVAQGGRPEFARKVRGLGLSRKAYTAAAVVLRKECSERGWTRGTIVPFDLDGVCLVGVFQKHTHTYRHGKKVKVGGEGLDGLTVFALER